MNCFIFTSKCTWRLGSVWTRPAGGRGFPRQPSWI